MLVIIVVFLCTSNLAQEKPQWGESNLLDPDWNTPCRGFIDVRGAINHPTSNDGANIPISPMSVNFFHTDNKSLPGTIVKSGQCASPSRMGHFAHIAGCGNAAERDSKPKYEAASKKCSPASGGRLYTGTNDNDKGAGEHSCAASKHIIDRTCEEYCSEGTYVVHSKDNSSRGISNFPISL